MDDQGILNSDPRFIAVPDNFINIIPTVRMHPPPSPHMLPSLECACVTQGSAWSDRPDLTVQDVRGLTFSRTPQMVSLIKPSP